MQRHMHACSAPMRPTKPTSSGRQPSVLVMQSPGGCNDRLQPCVERGLDGRVNYRGEKRARWGEQQAAKKSPCITTDMSDNRSPVLIQDSRLQLVGNRGVYGQILQQPVGLGRKARECLSIERSSLSLNPRSGIRSSLTHANTLDAPRAPPPPLHTYI